MQFKLVFDMNNEVFNSEPEFEVERILFKISNDVLNGETYGAIMDYNGNKVGSWEILD